MQSGDACRCAHNRTVVLDSGDILELMAGGSIGGSISGHGSLFIDGGSGHSLTPGATLAFWLLNISAELLIDGGTIDSNIIDYGGIAVTGGTLDVKVSTC